MLSVNLEAAAMANDPLRELFEACKTGDLVKVKKLITAQTVNARDTAGRKSTPLHFAAGKLCLVRGDCFCFSSFSLDYISGQRRYRAVKDRKARRAERFRGLKISIVVASPEIFCPKMKLKSLTSS